MTTASFIIGIVLCGIGLSVIILTVYVIISNRKTKKIMEEGVTVDSCICGNNLFKIEFLDNLGGKIFLRCSKCGELHMIYLK